MYPHPGRVVGGQSQSPRLVSHSVESAPCKGRRSRLLSLFVAVTLVFALPLPQPAIAAGDGDVPGVVLPASPVQDNLDSTTDPHDVYSVYLTSGSKLMLTLSASDDTYFDLYLFKPGTPTVYTGDETWYAASSTSWDSNESIQYTAPSTGIYYIDVRSDSGGSGSYRLTWQSAAKTADDDTPGVALSPSPCGGTLQSFWDEHDVYAITLTAGSRIALSLSGPIDTNFDLHVFKPGTPTVTTSDESWYAASSTNVDSAESIAYVAEATGTYYIDVRAVEEASGNYTLTWEKVAFGPDDDVPGVALPASPVHGDLLSFLDVHDVYSIAMTAGSRLTLTLSGPANTDFELSLFKPGTPSVDADHFTWCVASSTNGGSSESISYVAETTGTYYIDVRTTEASSGGYNLAWEFAAFGADDDVPGVVLPASPVHGDLRSFMDVHDVYSIAMTAGSRVKLALSGSGDSDFELYLFKPGTPGVAAEDPAWCVAASTNTGSDEIIWYTAPTTGTYYVDVRCGWEGSGAYTLAWESVAYGPDDHVPGITLPASPVAGSIHPQLDTHDVYALGVSAGAWICLDMTGQAGKDADLWLLKPGCPQLPEATDSSWVAAYSDGPDSNESVKYLAQTGGTYYVVVRSGLYVSGEESWENHELTWSTPPDINIDVTPMQVALGQVIVGQTKTVSVPVKNTATLPLHLSHATLSPSAGGLSVSVNPAPVTVQPGVDSRAAQVVSQLPGGALDLARALLRRPGHAAAARTRLGQGRFQSDGRRAELQ